MGYYDLSKEERQKFVLKIKKEIGEDLESGKSTAILHYSSDDDVYIRKNVSTIMGRIYRDQGIFQEEIIQVASDLLKNDDENVRQTAVYMLGEVGKKDADIVFPYLETALRDPHHKVRNSVMSTLKVMGQKKPEPTLKFAEMFIHDPDPEVRRKVVHGIELRGRTHPEDILPILEQLQYEENPQVKKMIIHVLGQISYKEGCLEKVTSALKTWNNKELVESTIPYIIEVHKKYPFSDKTSKEAEKYLKENFKDYHI
ncbi:HEAT repeat domain-containing protein [Methanobacterium petrolearium]|uniref:HEAT repeat domain-containing protein n=1 Tax=Methanobacterium petrolearium TaxID=710190 RepID=UPI001AE34458|nr:HEAT repeat domain-containing protein [Methanobacterium petrolearium]MBP1945870.1 3-methyladenine DNA glycosylase AlkC [Methanobacterium petrolearium]BDZ69578.1 hypothetical protein GCM10025861_00950 [Methanobacterium petrolearium]